jgi:hypothetical protein
MWLSYVIYIVNVYKVIHKSLRDFRPLRYSSRDGHAEGECVNRGRDTRSFCPTLHMLDMSTFGDEAGVNPVIKFLPHTLQHLAVSSSDCRRCYRPPDVATCVAGTWLQDWHLPHHQRWTYRAPVRWDRNLDCLSLCWHAPLRRDQPSYSTTEFGITGGTYELPCILWTGPALTLCPP